MRILCFSQTGKKQAKHVVKPRNGSGSRTGISHQRLLVDGNGRLQSTDALHSRASHLAHPLQCIRRKRTEIAIFGLTIDHIVHQRGLSRARYTGNQYQFILRNINTNRFQIVFRSIADANEIVLFHEANFVRKSLSVLFFY